MKLDLYDKDKGMKIYNLKNNNLLLFYNFENLIDNSKMFAYLFDIDFLRHTNNAKNRIYFEKYKKMQKKIVYNQQYINKLLNTKIMKYFYNKETIENFKKIYKR